MNLEEQIRQYFASQPELKRADMETLHNRMLELFPQVTLWFLDGRDESGKVVSNPNIGYGHQTIHYSNGKQKAFYQIGISGNTTGISVYILGLKDKEHLKHTWSNQLGKARVTGYCIKFKKLKDIHLDVLESAIRDGMEAGHQESC